MWIEETANGKYKFVEQYKDALTGKRKRVSVTYSKCTNATKKQALIELNKKIEENNKILDCENITLNELKDLYLEAKKEDVKSSTLETINVSITALLRKIDGDLIVSRITALNFKDSIKLLTPTDIKQFKMILSWGYKQGYLLEPIHLKISSKTTKVKKEDKLLYLEKEQLKDVLKKLDDHAITYSQVTIRYLTEFLALTGLRVGEALCLTEDDIKDNILSVNKTMYRGKIDTPKTLNSIRDITINGRVIQIVKEMKFAKRINHINSSLIFPSKKGKYMGVNLVSYNLKRIDKRLHPHLFRHTHASLLADEGIPLEMIQRRLGHKNDTITKEIYIHVTEKKKKEEAELFKELDIL